MIDASIYLSAELLERVKALAAKLDQDPTVLLNAIVRKNLRLEESAAQLNGTDGLPPEPPADADTELCAAIEDYRTAPSGTGSLAAEWKDKPHRLVYDLVREVQRLQGLERNLACDGASSVGCSGRPGRTTSQLVRSVESSARRAKAVGHDRKPSDMIATEPDRVIAAARAFYQED